MSPFDGENLAELVERDGTAERDPTIARLPVSDAREPIRRMCVARPSGHRCISISLGARLGRGISGFG
jgi:hypothetical protein